MQRLRQTVQFANISFYSKGLETATYRVDLKQITFEQFNPSLKTESDPSIVALDIEALQPDKNNNLLTWGIGPYFAHRLFNPDLPLSVETGIELGAGYQISHGLQISGVLRKSVLKPNQNKDGRICFSVHSDWPLDFVAVGHIQLNLL